MNVIRIAQYGRATAYAAVLFPPPASRYSKAMYSAIFTDIDGTLFRSDLTIGDATREAVREAAGKGIRIVLCSGRYITGMARAQEQLGIPVIYAAINGALIKDGGEYLRETMIGRKPYNEAASFLKGKAASIIAFCETKFAIDADDSWYERQNRICGDIGFRMDISDADEVESITGERPYKILVKDNDEDKLSRLIGDLRSLLGDSARVISSGRNNLEVLPPGIDKSDAIRIIADHLRIPVSETAAFGDCAAQRALYRGEVVGGIPPETDLIIDAIFGTGFRGTPEGDAAAAIEYINASGAKVVSADIPSGLNGDSGAAALSVTLTANAKIGRTWAEAH